MSNQTSPQTRKTKQIRTHKGQKKAYALQRNIIRYIDLRFIGATFGTALACISDRFRQNGERYFAVIPLWSLPKPNLYLQQ